jgi:hypothetical protein
MAFIQLGNDYYNEYTLGKAFTIIDNSGEEEITKYFVQTLGGQDIEITQEEYNDLIGEGE